MLGVLLEVALTQRCTISSRILRGSTSCTS
jgi:hypothetical protein